VPRALGRKAREGEGGGGRGGGLKALLITGGAAMGEELRSFLGMKEEGTGKLWGGKKQVRRGRGVQ